jgi:catechol 2,3-dioxygenase-like lactoylglutathione lyase family enzyme
VPTRLVHVVIEAADPERLGRFWADVFGWQVAPASAGVTGAAGAPGGEAGSDGSVMVRPSGWRYPDPGPLPLLLVPADGPKTGRNRLHFDVPTKSAAHHGDEVKRIIGLGATPVDVGQGDVPWEVLSDPEGNEFCVLDPRPGVYFDTGPVAAVVISCGDPAAEAAFWAQAAGWRRSSSCSSEDPKGGRSGLVGQESTALRAGQVRGPFLDLVADPGAAAAGHRARLDVAPLPGEDKDTALAALLAAGARPSDSGQPDAPWNLLSDPEGVEFRVLTPR